MQIGNPFVDGARVMAEVLEHGRDRKIIVFKYKNKTRYRRRHGHRQDFTRLAIRQILIDGREVAVEEKKPAGAPPRKRAAPKARTEPALPSPRQPPRRRPRRERRSLRQPPSLAAQHGPAKAAAAPKARGFGRWTADHRSAEAGAQAREPRRRESGE